MDDLIDHIYEAAFVPEEWDRVLRGINEISGSIGATIFVFSDNAPPRGRTLENLQPLFDEFVKGDFWKFCDSVQRMCSLRPGSFVHVDDFMTAEEIEKDPVRIRLREVGIGAHICSAIPTPNGELITYVFQRALAAGLYDQPAIDRLDYLRPHLARAGLVAARLGMERAKATVSGLKALGLPAAVLTSSGHVLTANTLLEEMSDVFLPAARERMSIVDPAADALLQQAIAERRGAIPLVRSIPLPGKEGRPPLVVHVLPLRRAAHDIFSGGDVLVVATTFSPSAVVPSVSLLNALFDLTPAEARLATVLTSGRSLKIAAGESGVTVKTARTYLERIFRKTGTHRQSELVALLKAAQPLSGGASKNG
ncbi:MAG: helix-turn-helix transcriptional regulator [Rhizobiaceae bacterium]|nr:helix-turn-helix transcriptional regulator [Rhizobiaceae bacterium]